MQETSNIGWIKVDATPIKNELTQTVQKWIEKFTSFLMDNFKTKLKNIEQWSKEVNEGITTLPNKDMEKFKKGEREKKLLITVMTHLRDVK